ncbi:FecR family protein [Seonamhaeicola marinus]|uniref:FecR family protein n=1 Tax=Seonamhaeicola marinus TaxID=1912246 RepID=A0A5D0J9I6_9FLAO|nr:FecR family protein [Seonamhaeicola marinus]TYA92239.1 FecR family protein [Seonamhaeicola marinus]
MKNDDLLKKWLNNELTDVDKQQFSEQEDYAFNERILEGAKHFKASEIYTTKNFESFKSYYDQKKPVKKLASFNRFLRIASVIVVGLGLYFAMFTNDSGSVQTLAGEKTTFELPDSSIVELNSLSSVTYNPKTWETERTLKLDGEAYFKVEKGSAFKVKTKAGYVTVLGTQFNVKQREKYFEVQCFEGVVSVEVDTLYRKLKAGDIFLILNDNFKESKTLDTFPMWTKNMSDFKAVPVAHVLSEIERQYNVQVVHQNTNIDRLFTGSFPHDNLEEALTSITQPLSLSFSISKSNLITIHGRQNK